MAVVIAALGAGSEAASAAFSNAADAIPATNGKVVAVAVAPSRIYIGGSFTTVGGTARNHIAAIDRSTGALDMGFNPGANQDVLALAVSGSTVYAAGGFSSIGPGNVTRNGVAQLNGDTGAVITTFDAHLNSGATPFGMRVAGSTVYIGGNFTVGTHTNVAQLDGTTGTPTAFDAGSVNGTVYALAVSGSGVNIGGSFSSAGGQSRNNIAQLDLTTGAATGLVASANSSVYALAVYGSYLYAGGFFTSINGTPRSHLAQLSGTTGTPTSWTADTDGSAVFGVTAATGSVFAVGPFTTIKGSSRAGLAQLDPGTGAPTAFNPGANASADLAVVATDGPGLLYVGCACTTIGGRSTGFARFTDPSPPTAVFWRGGHVSSVRHGMRITWRIVVNTRSLGFDVVRIRHGHRRTLTRRMIVAYGHGDRYAFVDRHGRRNDRYALVEHTLAGRSITHRVA